MSRSTILLAALLLATLPVSGAAAAEDAAVTVVPSAPPGADNAHHVTNRPPLLPSALVKLPPGAVRARGWLLKQLQLMADGMTGRLPELSRWARMEKSAWASAKGEGENPWEELPYWLRGFTSLGHVLGDERIQGEAKAWIDAVLSSQDEDGWFGPRENRAKGDLWPNMVMLNVLQTHHEATEDPRVLPFLLRYARWLSALPREKLLPGSWQKVRGGDNLASLHWLYNRTRERSLIDLGTAIHERTAPWADGVASWHGVDIAQGFKEPAVYYLQSKDARHLAAAERNYRQVMDLHGQVPGGMFGADETCRKGYAGPRQGAETCAMVELMLSFETLLEITGSPLHADRCEEVAFNSLPASHTADLKALHYLTAPNLVQCDRENKAPAIENSGTMLSFSPGEVYRCCQHNAGHGWPYFTERLWMATCGNGLAAVLYAPSEVTAVVGDGVKVKIEESTHYPFDDTISFRISTPRKASFPLALRIPAWAEGAGASLNGRALEAEPAAGAFLSIDRTWSDGDVVRLVLPMKVSVRRWAAQGDAASVSRGPLTYSLKIKERWARYGGTDRWPEREVFPGSPWNYALRLDPASPESSFEVVANPDLLPVETFDLEKAPVVLEAKGRRIPAWKMDGGLAANPPKSPVRSGEPEEEILLVPMGFARLRITAFPVLEGP